MDKRAGAVTSWSPPPDMAHLSSGMAWTKGAKSLKGMFAACGKDNPYGESDGDWRKKGPEVSICAEGLWNLRCESANIVVKMKSATPAKRHRLS